jgi:hypothetical protein
MGKIQVNDPSGRASSQRFRVSGLQFRKYCQGPLMGVYLGQGDKT